jgi:hypothetical protein
MRGDKNITRVLPGAVREFHRENVGDKWRLKQIKPDRKKYGIGSGVALEGTDTVTLFVLKYNSRKPAHKTFCNLFILKRLGLIGEFLNLIYYTYMSNLMKFIFPTLCIPRFFRRWS